MLSIQCLVLLLPYKIAFDYITSGLLTPYTLNAACGQWKTLREKLADFYGRNVCLIIRHTDHATHQTLIYLSGHCASEVRHLVILSLTLIIEQPCTSKSTTHFCIASTTTGSVNQRQWTSSIGSLLTSSGNSNHQHSHMYTATVTLFHHQLLYWG